MNKNYENYERSGLLFIRNKVIRDTNLFGEMFTTRMGGESEPPYDGLNTGFNTNDREKKVKKNLQKIKKALHIKKIYAPKQTHSDRVMIVDDENKGYIKDEECDALITCEKNTPIAVKVADCIASIIVDPENRVIAAVHSGWKGVANKIIQNTVDKMVDEFGCNPANLIVSMSPAISNLHLKMGEDIVKELQKDPAFSKIFKERADGIYMDVWRGSENLLLEKSVKKENIYINNMCTYKHKKLFFSYRRDNTDTGRMMNVVWIK